MLAARLGRRQACLGRLASLRLGGWQGDALDRRLEDGGAPLARASALASGAALPPPPPHAPPCGVRLAAKWAVSSLSDSCSSSGLSSMVCSNGSTSSGRAWQAAGGRAVPPVCSSPAARLRQAAVLSRGFASSSSSSSSTDSDSSSGSEEEAEEPVRPELSGELAPLAALCGVTDRAVLAAKVAALGPKREQGVRQHGSQVAAHLQQLGVQQTQLARLLLRCPLLFSWPAEERAALLFEQLMGRLGLTAAEAARCFEQQPAAAGSDVNGCAESIEAMAELFEAAGRGKTGSAGSKADAALSEAERQAGQRQAGQLLRDAPAAVGLLYLDAAKLRRGGAIVQQRCSLNGKQLATFLKANWSLIGSNVERQLEALEAVLQEVLGVDGTPQVNAMLRFTPRTLGCTPSTMRDRCQALLEVFTQEQLRALKERPLADLLVPNTATWQLALALWRAMGVADPAATLLNNTRLATLNWLAPSRLANLLALQRSLGLGSPGAVVQQGFAGYAGVCGPERLAGRLLFLEQAGLLPLLVASKEDWRRERGLPANKPSPGEPPLISVHAISRPAGEFCAAAGVDLKTLQAFTAPAALASHQPYQQLLAEAAALAERLKAEHPEVARLAASHPTAEDDAMDA